jgi:hypothetical protein
MNTEKQLLHLFHERGFKGRRTILQRKLPEVIHAAKIGKSRFAPDFLVDMGIVLPNAPYAPQQMKLGGIYWHIHTRLGKVYPDRKYAEACLAENVPMPEEERFDRLREIVDYAEHNFFIHLRTERDVVRYVRDREDQRLIVFNGAIMAYAESPDRDEILGEACSNLPTTATERQLLHLFHERGFKGRGLLLQRRFPEVLMLAKIARSGLAPDFLVDIGIVLPGAPHDPEQIKSGGVHWHIHTRLCELYPDREHVEACLTESVPMLEAERFERLREIVNYVEYNFFIHFKTERDVVRYVRESEDQRVVVFNSAIMAYAETGS